MSRFRVIKDAEGSYDDFADDSRYYFDHGFLVTIRSDGERRTWSPSGWLYVEDSEPPSVGG